LVEHAGVWRERHEERLTLRSTAIAEARCW
jgi:hypothetical protein